LNIFRFPNLRRVGPRILRLNFLKITLIYGFVVKFCSGRLKKPLRSSAEERKDQQQDKMASPIHRAAITRMFSTARRKAVLRLHRMQ